MPHNSNLIDNKNTCGLRITGVAGRANHSEHSPELEFITTKGKKRVAICFEDEQQRGRKYQTGGAHPNPLSLIKVVEFSICFIFNLYYIEILL